MSLKIAEGYYEKCVGEHQQAELECRRTRAIANDAEERRVRLWSKMSNAWGDLQVWKAKAATDAMKQT